MLPSTTWLNAIRTASGARSDYHLAQLLDVSKGTVSFWKKGAHGFGTDIAPKVANLIHIPSEAAVLAASYWKAQTDAERQAFHHAYYALGGGQVDDLIEKLADHREAA